MSNFKTILDKLTEGNETYEEWAKKNKALGYKLEQAGDEMMAIDPKTKKIYSKFKMDMG